jgi:hypothetical protein
VTADVIDLRGRKSAAAQSLDAQESEALGQLIEVCKQILALERTGRGHGGAVRALAFVAQSLRDNLM